MKISQKVIFPVIIMIMVCVVLYQCKSPEKPKETSTDILTVIDSVETVSAQSADTIASIADTVISHIPLTLIVNNLASPTAPVIVGVYNSKHHFLDKKYRLKGYDFIPNGKSLTTQITDLPYGELALAIYQDVNNNGKFDKTLIGIPKEAYAFSNNFTPKSKAPAYGDCKFKYDSITNLVTINLIK